MRVIALLSFLALASADELWGNEGHAIVANIAQSFLTPEGKAGVLKYLPLTHGLLGPIASWADDIRNDRHWTSGLHFINSPDWTCTYIPTRDCGKDECVDGAIHNYTKRMADNALPAVQHEEAIKFLVHFVGDIHQPLHVGFASDKGGNSITGTFFGASLNLHSLWDSRMLDRRIATGGFRTQANFTDYLLNRLTRGNWTTMVPGWQKCHTATAFDACSTEWASESISLACKNSYVDADGTTHLKKGFALSDAYFNRNWPVLETQFAKAGVRLAHVINRVFSPKRMAFQ